MAKGKSVCVKVYLNQELFLEIIKQAEKTGKRRMGLIPYTQKDHGFAHEKLANTDGIGRYLKHTHRYFVENEAERLRKAVEIETRKAAILKESAKLEDEKKRLGI